MDFDGAGAYPLTNNGSLNLLPSWDAGGKGIFFTSYVGGDPDVYRAALGKSDNLVRITTFPGLEMNAVVARTERESRLFYQDDNAEIYVMNRDGSNLTRLTNSWA
jgi:Tol biopolymer transport system component